MLDGLVDIYHPDFKYMDAVLAKKYSHAQDYPEIAKEALSEMVRQVGEAEFDSRGMMKKGVIVRQLLYFLTSVLSVLYFFSFLNFGF